MIQEKSLVQQAKDKQAEMEQSLMEALNEVKNSLKVGAENPQNLDLDQGEGNTLNSGFKDKLQFEAKGISLNNMKVLGSHGVPDNDK